jgi:PAS domain-containing protein
MTRRWCCAVFRWTCPSAGSPTIGSRQVVEAAPNGILMTDADGRIILTNAQLEQDFGYSRQS